MCDISVACKNVAFQGCLIATLIVGWVIANSSCLNAETLTVGSIAPKLDIEHWVQNGEGKFPKITEFEPGKIYVIEFWATWCGPCIQSMPHIAELQKEYEDKGVQIVSISDESIEKVEAFLDRKIPNAGEGLPQDYRELTRLYCLTTDPDMSSKKDYMRAAKQNGIPCAFLVGKDAKIEWIGHPLEMDSPLQAVVEGTWDREKFGASFRAEQAREALMLEADTKITAIIEMEKYAEAIVLIDSYLEKADTDEMKFNLSAMKLPVLGVLKASSQEFEVLFGSLLELAADQPMLVNQICQQAYEMFIQEQMQSKGVIEMAKARLSKVSSELPGRSKAIVLDTLAHLQFVSGDLKNAIKSQSEAVELTAGKRQAKLKEFLDELKTMEDK